MSPLEDLREGLTQVAGSLAAMENRPEEMLPVPHGIGREGVILVLVVSRGKSRAQDSAFGYIVT